VLQVEIAGQRRTLKPGQQLTFGRDPGCDICVGPDDVGISRTAGRISSEGGDRWYIHNLSDKRTLHVVDAAGFAVPLPASTMGIQSRRLVDAPHLTIMIVGEVWSHTLVLTTDVQDLPPTPTGPADPRSTRTQVPPLPDERREVLVALARGYLRKFPDYDPRPSGYQDVASLLGLTPQQVDRHVEDAMRELAAAGLPPLEDQPEPRTALCDWLVASGVISPPDAQWLQSRLTANPAHDEVTRVAQRVGNLVAPLLRARLEERYGRDWLSAVNANRPPQHRRRDQNLRDFRFCLAVLAYDPATRGWASEPCRRAALELNRLANMAAHAKTVTPGDAGRAVELARLIEGSFPLA
jgi:hypothetical protein